MHEISPNRHYVLVTSLVPLAAKLDASKSSGPGVPGGAGMTAGLFSVYFALSFAASPGTWAGIALKDASPASWFFHVPWPCFETGEVSGVLSNSTGTVFMAGVAVSKKGWTGAVPLGL